MLFCVCVYLYSISWLKVCFLFISPYENTYQEENEIITCMLYVPEKEFNSMIQRYGSKMLSDL